MKASKFPAALLLLLSLLALNAGEFGFCSHLQRYEFPDADQTLALLKANGATLVRFDFDWVQIEPKPGVYRFDRYDHLFTLAQKHGIEIEGIFGAVPPKWCRPLEKHQKEYLAYVEAFTRHFKGRLKYVEIVNETNLQTFWGSKPNPEAYAAFLKKSYQLIKSIDPNVTVLYSGTARIPLDFIEKSLKTDLTGSVDAFNIHPYSVYNEPEFKLPGEIGKLHTLLSKYGFAKTPVWVTEIGASTGTNINVAEFFRAAFAEAKIDPAESGVAVLRDEDVGIGSMWYTLPDAFGNFARCRSVSATELKDLDPRKYNVLLLPAEEVVHAAAPAGITEFLKKGGTVVSLNHFPAYYERVPGKNGSYTVRKAGTKNAQTWHLGVSGWWFKDERCAEAPHFLTSVTADGLFLLNDDQGKKVNTYKTQYPFFNRHLTTKDLKDGDTFKPLLFGCHKEYKRPIAGVYNFNSDLKGHFIIFVDHRYGVLQTQCCTPDVQARRIGRELLLCRGLGIEKVVVYKFRSSERVVSREGHFGVINRDFSAKPALAAFRTLTQLRPEGCSPVKLDHDKLLWRAVWQTPDKKFVTALWRVCNSEKVKLSGKVEKAVDYLGNPVWVDPASFPVSDGITYFIGPAPVTFVR